MFACLIDIGNTSMKVGIASSDALIAAYSFPTDTSHTGDSLGLCLMQFIQHAGIHEPLKACFISSVVPAFEPIVRHAVERFLSCTPCMVPTDYPIPLENKYARPHEVGADRLVAAYAARRLFPAARSVISVDYGTATTFDCVTDNAYLGGLIAPGVLSSLGALALRTARLPRIALGRDRVESTSGTASEPLIGKDTSTSLNHGFLYGFAAMTEGLIVRLRATLEGPVSIVASGGFAEDVASVTDCFDAVQTDLILEGLRNLWLNS